MSVSSLEKVLEVPLAALGFRPTAATADFVNGDTGTIVEVKDTITGLRDVHASIAQLALALDRAGMEHAYLAIWSPQVTLSKLENEWAALLGIMLPSVSRRLHLVAVTRDDALMVPEDALALELVKCLRDAASPLRKRTGQSSRSFETLKVLLMRWLRREPPISIRHLQEITGLSHPTVADSIKGLGELVERGSNRSVALRAFPAEQWAQLVALAPRLRSTIAYADRSGRPGLVETFIDRVRRKPLTGVAIGGVLAARHWQPDFDLHGTPRLDLCVHSPSGWMDLSFLSKLGSTLEVTQRGSVVLALHAVTRDEALFARGDGTAWADPVETLLDLHELKLRTQADDFVRYLRGRR